MKKICILSAVAISGLALGFQACTNETPFAFQGEGKIYLSTEMYSDVELATRAIDSDSKQVLEDKMTIYISNDKGVIRQYSGVKNVNNPVTLKVGEYVIDAWTGDSVPVSYDLKYYRGQQKFTVENGENTQVKLDVNIANVIVAVNTDNLDLSVSEFTVTFNHSRASLYLNKPMVDEGKKIYFMMPTTDKDLHYKVEVTGADGTTVTEEGDIPNVERAHQYTLNLLSEQPENDKGGALIRIEILDIPVHDKTMFVYPAPAFKAELGGEPFNAVENQIDCTDDNYKDFNLRVVSYYGLNSLVLNFDSEFEGMEAVNGKNIWNNGVNASDAISKLESLGIKYEHLKDESVSDDNGLVKVHEGWLKFSNEFFSKLKDNEKEYTIEIIASDGRAVPISNSIKLRIANNLKAVDNKLVSSVEAPDSETQPMAILSTSATLEGILNSNDAQVYGIEYRENGSSDNFEKVYATRSLSRAAGDKFSVIITGLKPGKTYEYKAFCDEYEEQKSKTFTTESQFSIPNAGMDDWSTCNDVTKNTLIPNANGVRSFWDTGNHGSMSLGALGGKNITTQDQTFIPGNSIACLQSQFVGVATVGRLAAGNLFVGEFIKTIGTTGAQLKFGREFNGSHPSALKVDINYRPGIVDYSQHDALKKEATDQGQIYVALATEKVELNTAEGIYFNEKADNIIAFGQITWDSNVGDEQQLESVTIPLKYYEKAKAEKANYLIIVCSASKYGDYFTGSSKSVMYLDDFELEYGDITFE